MKIPQSIIVSCKVMQAVSPKLLTPFLAKLFTTPIRHKLPKREYEMDTNAVKQMIHVKSIKKDVMTYQVGTGSKKILLVHGWSGRGTQLVKFADEYVKLGYTVVEIFGKNFNNAGVYCFNFRD